MLEGHVQVRRYGLLCQQLQFTQVWGKHYWLLRYRVFKTLLNGTTVPDFQSIGNGELLIGRRWCFLFPGRMAKHTCISSGERSAECEFYREAGERRFLQSLDCSRPQKRRTRQWRQSEMAKLPGTTNTKPPFVPVLSPKKINISMDEKYMCWFIPTLRSFKLISAAIHKAGVQNLLRNFYENDPHTHILNSSWRSNQ